MGGLTRSGRLVNRAVFAALAIAAIGGIQPAGAEPRREPRPGNPPTCTVTPVRAVHVFMMPNVAPDAVTDRLEELKWEDLTLTFGVPADATADQLFSLLSKPDQRQSLFGKTVEDDAVILVVGGGTGDDATVERRAAHGVISTDADQLMAARFDQARLRELINVPLLQSAGVAREIPRAVARDADTFEIVGTRPWVGPSVSAVIVALASSPDRPLLCSGESRLSLPVMVRVDGVPGVGVDDLSVSTTVGLNAKATSTPPKPAVAAVSTSPTRFWPVAAAAVASLLAAVAAALYARSRRRPGGNPGGLVQGGFPPLPPMSRNGGSVAEPYPARYFEEPAMEHSPPVAPAPGWTAAIPGGSAIRASDLGLLRVAPHQTARGHSWSHATSKWILASGWVEKVQGKGEDAEPVMRVHESGRGLLAVFDGTGGAGSASARRLPDGSDLSGAYVASRLAREVSESWFTQFIGSGSGARPDPAQLQDQLMRALQDEMTYPDVPQSMVKGRLHRILPTTLAGVAFASTGDEVQVEAMWAGDSRCYALTAGKGLQVLSVDDTPETDALALIRNDQPMSNLVCADRPFVINRLGYRLGQPAVMLTATDGCFGYVRTPAHFEYLILKSLMESAGPQDWADLLVESVAAIASDDCSFSLAAVGFGDFITMRETLRPRFSAIADAHWAPFQRAQSADEIEALRISSWELYRNTYHELALQDARR